MGRRRNDMSLERRKPSRTPKIRILILCEGKQTEPEYLREVQRHFRNQRIHIDVRGPMGAPIDIIRRAIKQRDHADAEARRSRDEYLRWDEVWAVFDVDAHSVDTIKSAQKLAQSSGILLAISNPCFELWALLHFVDQQAHIEVGKVQRALKRHLPGYGKRLPFAKVHATYDDAVRCAQELETVAKRKNCEGGNPTTGVHKLTESIRTR